MSFPLFVCESASFDPYENLAVEEALLNEAGDKYILYLWQNENTVVIGRNQNPWRECRLALLSEEGGRLARRLSGGGAVFHDLGNLNFTLLMPQSDFDIPRQLSVIRRALLPFGIDAAFSGRNDLLADGRKFSGSAYYKNGDAAYHRGTLMVRADMEKLQRYLSPSKAKLQSKGVDSVRSRVINLTELCPSLTLPALKAELRRSFEDSYGGSAAAIAPAPAPVEKYRSHDWLYGRPLPFTACCSERFSWGEITLELRVEQGVIEETRVSTDAMDASLAPRLESALRSCPLQSGALSRALAPWPDVYGLLLRSLL